MVRMVPTWLPPELVVSQPYSMGPALRWSPPMPAGFTAPAHGTVKNMDDDRTTGNGVHGPSAQWFLFCGMFIAPRAMQQDPKRDITMVRPRGLLESLGQVPEQPQHIEPVSEVTREEAERAFADALAALEDDDE